MNKVLTYIALSFALIISSCNKEEINELEKRNEELIAQTASLQKQINNLTLDISNLAADNETLSSNNITLSNQITALQNKINELEDALNSMTNDYEEALTENDELYDEYLSLTNSKNELQVQLDNLVSEINRLSCSPIELSSSDMLTEQLFCTWEQINPIVFEYDESVYSFSFIQDSIPQGISIIKNAGNVRVIGTPYSDQRDLFSFDLNFTSDQCEKIKRITLARSPDSPTITYVSGTLAQSIETGAQIDPVKYTYGGSAEGLSFNNLPEGLTYSVDGNIYTIEGAISEVGSYSIQVSTVNQSGCMELYETLNLEVEQSVIQPTTPPPTTTPPGGGPTTQYLLTVNTGANGSVSSTGGTYDDGTSISITASPDVGYSFVNWTDSSGNEIGTDLTYTFNISSDTTITANFEIAYFYLDPNGVTIRCPLAVVGAIGTVNGVQYEKVDRNGLLAMRNAGEDLSLVCTSGITSLAQLFRKKGSFNDDISSWDTSSVTTMERLFANAKTFNQDISKWDVSNVTSMFNLLNGANAFNQDISGWDVSSVTSMRGMFRNTYNFNADIGGWDVSNVKFMKEMLHSSLAFNQDISGWDVSSVEDMRQFLHLSQAFNQNISGWNVNNVTKCSRFDLDSQSMDINNRPGFTNCDPDAASDIIDSDKISN